MTQSLADLLGSFRTHAKTEREKGAYFEKLVQVFLLNDPVQAQQYENAWPYADWAKLQGIDGRDVGIDLVAKLRDEEGYCAVQCKFYGAGARIARGDIDSFISASGRAPFVRRLIIDTTDADWGENAENALKDQHIPSYRLGLSDLAESPIDWAQFARDETVLLAPKKKPRPHQVDAIKAVEEGLATAHRGKVIMACGTGKTFTSLKIAEKLVGKGGRVLYLVPSLSLMSQTVREWTIDTETSLRSFAVCSDVQVGKRRAGDDIADLEIHDLAFPATTDPKKLAFKGNVSDAEAMTVVFSTYQSIQVVADAQTKHKLPEFDLIICDEAHRTTGAKFEGEEESNFIKVHDQSFIKGKKRIYMTATPRIYGEAVQSRAAEASVELCSMDNPDLYGEVLFERGFSWAVENGLLTDYKVIVLAVDEEMVSASVQKRLADGTQELKLDDATKIIGCYKALTKSDLKADVSYDPLPMRRALAFCRDIKSSKLIAKEFEAVVEEYLTNVFHNEELRSEMPSLTCELDHVDGTFNAKSRSKLLDWLRNNNEPETCRILSNARCLSEGVDVPALDAILFLHPRKSQIDVVQSVGRVMRRAEGKKLGYVILPVGVPAGVEPDQALNNNEKYRVVWQILNALRAHDDRFDATINKMGLGQDVSERIEVIAITNDLPSRSEAEDTGLDLGVGTATDGNERDHDISRPPGQEPRQTSFIFDEISSAILAKIVKKCGRRAYWEDWATNIGEIAQNHITRLKGLLKKGGTKERQAFDEFLKELRDDLNDSVTEEDAIEMLAQHIITRPVFEVLFEGHQFTKENPVSQAMQHVLDVLNEANLDKESKDLEKFYASVQSRAKGITDPQAKQRLIVELYEKFFKNAFPRTTDRLGIVYTPVEIVDFIIHSVNEVLQEEFGQTLGSKGVHIIDPFTGTGTFITRLLQSGLIAPEELEHKYRKEIHANEIVLLAYYIAAVNIEAVYHGLAGGDYVPFEGICLTDTFQMYEKEDLISRVMPDNSKRRKLQKAQDIRVIVGNPPYSAGQGSANDNNANLEYPSLDARIRDTYAARSTATLKNSLYDSYIRAIRWGSDRLGETGVMAFVSNAGWIDGNAMDGLRRSLADEFTSIYVFHLRGNARTAGDQRRKEKGNVFGEGTRTPVAISLLIKNPKSKRQGQIHFCDIGDYLTQEQKLAAIQSFGSVEGIEKVGKWLSINPDAHGDWLKQRNSGFASFMPLGNKDSADQSTLFRIYTSGLKTNRDYWCYNFSKSAAELSISKSIAFYNAEVDRYRSVSESAESISAVEFINRDTTKISWDRAEIEGVQRGRKITFDPQSFILSEHRPFNRQWCYFNRRFNNCVYQLPALFPSPSARNRLIWCTGPASSQDFTCFMSDRLPDLQGPAKVQCFPLNILEEEDTEPSLLASAKTNAPLTGSGLSDSALSHFKTLYSDGEISKEDIFYYIYGMLHSPEYRSAYADNLRRELPRIPPVTTTRDFWLFSRAGRALGELHVNYETIEPYPVTIKQGDLRTAIIKDPKAFYRVEKMRFGGNGREKDKATVVYNTNITMQDIPLEAYDYVVNGKPALEWVMERQAITTDKASGIVNDANCYANETAGDPAYPLNLFQRVITVSLETMKIVRSLPKLDIAEPKTLPTSL